MAGMGVVAHAFRKLLRTAIAIISLRIAVTSFREATAPAPPGGVTLPYDRGPNVWGCGQVGSGAAFAQGAWPARAAAMPVSPRRSSRLVPNSSSLLTQRHRRRSTGPANTLRTGAADETLRMAKGMLHVSRARCRRRAASRAPRRRTSLRPGTLAGRARRGDDALGMGRRLPEPRGLRGAGVPHGAGGHTNGLRRRGGRRSGQISRRRSGSRPRRAAIK